MEKLNFRNIEKHISDAIIYDMASNYCVPALYEYLRRIRSRINSQHTSKYKKMFRDIKRLHANFSKTHKKFISLNHLLSLSSKEITIEAKKLTLITPKLYDAPVRALVSPVNSDYINKSFMSQRLGYRISHMTNDLNKGKFRFEDEIKLSNRQLYEIKASILFLNWFLVKPVYIRPVVGFMKYSFNSITVKNYTSMTTVAFLNLIGARQKLTNRELNYLEEKICRKEGKYFIRSDSDKLRNFLDGTPSNRLKTIRRLYKSIYKMGLIELELLDRLPIFVILNKLSESDYRFLKRLFDLGYNRLLHLRFLEDKSFELLQDKRLQEITLKLASTNF